MKGRIAVLEGDGIGPEIVAEGLKVLGAVSERFGHTFEITRAPFGASAYFLVGHPFPERTKDICDSSDAILKGPVGLPVDEMERIPIELRPEPAAVLAPRERYDTYANYRPVRLPPALKDLSPLRPEVVEKGIDIMIVRELTGGIYFGAKREAAPVPGASAEDSCTYTYEQVRRIAAAGFAEARSRGEILYNIHKANVLATSRFWNAVVGEVSADYPDVTTRGLLVDNVAFQLCRNPTSLNGVLLVENMQGDILSDLAAGPLGSLGLMPSACLGPGKGYFEPAHGSAPDIAGTDRANPVSMIGCVALLLDKSFGLRDESEAVWKSVFGTISKGGRTADLSYGVDSGVPLVGTREFGDLVAEGIARSPRAA